MPELTVGNWIAIVGLFIASVSSSVGLASFLATRRERRSNANKDGPLIQANINADTYEGGWRSVQLHVVPRDDREQNFPYQFWRIERAALIRPKNAKLARAADDDYGSGVFYPEKPLRVLEGRRTGSQRAALHFFIKFQGDERGQTAHFNVVYSHIKMGDRRTAVISAKVAGLDE